MLLPLTTPLLNKTLDYLYFMNFPSNLLCCNNVLYNQIDSCEHLFFVCVLQGALDINEIKERLAKVSLSYLVLTWKYSPLLADE